MNKEDFSKLYNQIDEQNEKTSNFAVEAIKNLKFLQENGILDEFQKLSTPSQRQGFIASNDIFKKFLKNYQMFSISLGESLETYTEILNGVSGSNTASSNESKSEE